MDMGALGLIFPALHNRAGAEVIEMGSNRDRVQVDPDGNWKKIVQILLPGYKGLGTVKVGSDTECVLALEEKSNTYYAVDARGYRPLNQRKVRAALGLPEPVGQPRKGYELREVYSMRLEPTLAEYARELGGDNLSEGVAIALRFHMEKNQAKKK